MTNKVLALLNRRSFLIAVFFGLALTLVAQSSFTTSAHGAIVGTGVKVPASGGDKESAAQNCAADFAVVGVALTPVGGTTPSVSFGVFCRGIGSNGALLLSDQSTTSNTTKVGSGNTTLFCGPGKVVTGMSFVKWTNVGIRCATAPTLNENNLVIWMAAYSTGAQDTNCSTSELMSGFYTRTGAWTDAIGAVCSPYVLNKITFNSNSATTGTAPAALTQSSLGAQITLPNFTGTRTGFTFDDWNTLANGTGTDYAVGSPITPSAALTLFANWRSTITYNANNGGATATGSVPLPTIAKSSYAVTALAANSSPLAINGYTFSGWNSRADLTGTLYPVASFGPIVDSPYMHFDAKNFNDSTNAWLDDSGNNRSIPGTAITLVAAGTTPTNTAGAIRGDPKLIPNVSGTNGSLAAFPAVQGTTADGIVIGNADLSKFTFCYVARYAGSNRERIFTGTKENWVSGFIVNATDFFYHTTTDGTYSASLGQVSGNLDWKVMCDSGGAPITVRSNGVLVGTSTIATIMPEMTINLYNSRINPTQTSHWAVAEMFIFDSILSDAKILQLEAQLKDKYQITAMTATPGTVNYAATGDTTLYAQWNSTITYDANGSTSGTVPAATIVKGIGATATLATNSGTLARTGYSFSGWSTQADGTGTNYAAGSSSYQTVGNTTLYAKWVRTISFNTNTATGTAPADILIVNSATTTITLPSEGNLLKTGFSFGGWSATPSGAANTSPYATPASASTTLYAKWSANTYLVSYDTATATSGTMATSSYTAGTAAALRTNALARTGYSFDGWNTAANGTGTAYVNSSSLTIYNNLTLYPQWKLRAPGVPTVTVLAGNGEVTITATAVTASATVGPATSILVTAYSSGGGALSPAKTCTIYPPATTCVISGLTNGTAYQFAASATNTTNTSALSTKVNGTPTSYLVTYNATGNGGTSTTASAIFTKPTALVLPSATRAGFTFSGWYTLQSGGTLVGGSGSSYSPTSAVTLYANFTAIAYTISYDGNGSTGGNVPASGTYIISSTAPTKVGYTFNGWNTAANGSGTNIAAGSTYTTSANLSLFAQWTPVARTITYALAGGTSDTRTATLTGKFPGNSITLPIASAVNKTGYTFAGWSDGTTTYSGGAVWTVPASDSNFTFTAIWNIQLLSYRYDTNGGGTAPTSGTINYGSALTLAASNGLVKAGYNFTGWNDGTTTSNAGASVTINIDKVFVAQWSTITYSISYDANNGTGNTVSGSFIGGGVPYPIAINGFLRSGYRFTGWNTAANGSGTAYVVGSGYSTASDLVLYATWSANDYSVTYSGNGATSGTLPAVATFTTGQSFTVNSNAGNLVKTGYSFDGWNTAADGSGTNYAAAATTLTTTSNLTLYAKWLIKTLTITFSSGTGTASTQFPANTTAQYASLYTLPSSDTSTYIGGQKYDFTGWSDGSTTYAAGTAYRIGDSNLIFTAQWVAIYTVKYVLNGGSGAVPADVVRTESYSETLTLVVPTKSGFTFNGWKDQTGSAVSGSSFTVSSNRYILSAQWVPAPRTLTFTNGGSGASGSQSSITGKVIGDIATLPSPDPSLSKTGYTFGGWSDGIATYPAGGTFVVGSSDVTFTALWISNAYVITYNGNGATAGTVPASGTYNPGSADYVVSANPAAPNTLVKAGYTFAGWNTAANGGGGDYVAGTGLLTTFIDRTLYAKWNPSEFSVSYDTDGGTLAPSAVNKFYGTSFTLPTAPTKTGSNFLGWETGSGASANLYPAGSNFVMISTAVLFKAKWSGIYYAVTYLLNGGSGTAPTQADVASGGNFNTAAAQSRAGFTFTGWNDGSSLISATTSITNITGNSTLTAQWTIALPGISAAPTVVPGEGNVRVTPAIPATGGTVSQFTVTASPGSATCTVTLPDTNCVITPLTNGTSYTFTTVATNSAGSSLASPASAAATPASVPSLPTGITGSGAGGTVNLAWMAPTDNGGSAITDYLLQYRVVGSGSWTTFSDGVSTNTTATVTGLSAATEYEFRVTAINIIGNSTPSFASTVFLSSAPPAIVSVVAADAMVTVTLSAPSNSGSSVISSYPITAYDAFNVAAGFCLPLPGALTCDVIGLTNGTAYTFKAIATTVIAGDNTDSLPSAASAAVTPARIASPPTNVVATISGANVNLSFTAPLSNGGAAITGYTATSDPGGITGTLSGATAGTITITGLASGSAYSFTVVATNSAGSSTASPPSLSVTLAAATAPDAPTIALVTTTNATSATISFTAPVSNGGSAITSYTATSDPGGITGTVTGSGSGTITVNGLTTGTAYVFTVVATNNVGSSTPSGQSLAVTPVTPSTPISTCDSACQVALAAATAQAAADKLIADRAAADKLIADRAAADKLIADRAAADKLIADRAAADRALAEVSAKLKAAAIAAALATKTAIENATVVTAVKIIADTAIVEAAATVTAAAVAQVVADKASADAITAAKKDAVTVVAKAITTKAASTAVADAVAAIKAAADIAAKLAIKNQSVPPKTSTQVDIAINALKPNVSSAQLIAQANAVAAAAKTAANAAAQTALKQAAAVKATASQAQKLAAETAAKISSEQKSASAAAILAKSAAESVVKALEIKIATAGVAKAAVSELAKKLEEQLTLVDQAAKATDVTVRLELEKKISESAIAISEQEKIVTSANSNADEAAVKQETAAKAAASAKALADQQSKVAANMKLIAIKQSKIANKALAAAAVANLVATAAVAAAAKVPAKAVIAAQPPPVKNSTTATITGLKPGQKLKVTINVKPVK